MVVQWGDVDGVDDIAVVRWLVKVGVVDEVIGVRWLVDERGGVVVVDEVVLLAVVLAVVVVVGVLLAQGLRALAAVVVVDVVLGVGVGDVAHVVQEVLRRPKHVPAAQAQRQIHHRATVDVVVGERLVVRKRSAGKGQPLLSYMDAQKASDSFLDIVKPEAGHHIDRNGLSRRRRPHEDLHVA